MPHPLLARAFAPLLGLLLALAALTAQAQPPSPALQRVEGTTWFSVQRSAGGLGVSHTFLQGGRVVEHYGAMLDFTYRDNNDELVMTLGGKDIRFRFTIDDNKLTLRGEDGSERVHVRAGPRSSPPELHGLWWFKHENGAEADLFFDGVGRGLMRVLMLQRDGTYRATDDGALVMQMNGGNDTALTVSVEGNAMEIRGGGKTVRLRAVVAR